MPITHFILSYTRPIYTNLLTYLVTVLVLGVGDPCATLVGKRWGKYYKLIGQKSLAGFIGFVTASFTVVFLFLYIRRPLLDLSLTVFIAATAGFVGTLYSI